MNSSDPRTCPVCGQASSVECRFPPAREYACDRGHDWHLCPVHRVKVPGRVPAAACTCPAGAA